MISEPLVAGGNMIFCRQSFTFPQQSMRTKDMLLQHRLPGLLRQSGRKLWQEVGAWSIKEGMPVKKGVKT